MSAPRPHPLRTRHVLRRVRWAWLPLARACIFVVGCDSAGPVDEPGTDVLVQPAPDAARPPDALIYCLCPNGAPIPCTDLQGNPQTALELKDNLPADCLDCAIVTDECAFIDAGPGLAGYGFGCDGGP